MCVNFDFFSNFYQNEFVSSELIKAHKNFILVIKNT